MLRLREGRSRRRIQIETWRHWHFLSFAPLHPTVGPSSCLQRDGVGAVRCESKRGEQITTMFGNLGKLYSDQIVSQLESCCGNVLTSNAPQSTEQATETLGKVHGHRRALFVGINYVGQKGELRGCINDVKNIKNFLTDNYDIDESLVLTDDQKDPKSIPTRANILNAFRWLREGAKAGDSLIFHYSGHGGSVKD